MKLTSLVAPSGSAAGCQAQEGSRGIQPTVGLQPLLSLLTAA